MSGVPPASAPDARGPRAGYRCALVPSLALGVTSHEEVLTAAGVKSYALFTPTNFIVHTTHIYVYVHLCPQE